MIIDFNSIQEKPVVAKLLCGVFLVFIVGNLLGKLSDFRAIFKEPAVISANAEIFDDNLVKNMIKSSLEVDVFGKYVPKHFGEVNIKPSILNVKVIGILFSEDKINSEVVLRGENSAENIFKIGDVIPGGAKILRIYKDGIVIDCNGVTERLNLPKEELIFSKPPKNLFD